MNQQQQPHICEVCGKALTGDQTIACSVQCQNQAIQLRMDSLHGIPMPKPGSVDALGCATNVVVDHEAGSVSGESPLVGSSPIKYTGHTRCPKCNQVHWMHGGCPSKMEIEQPTTVISAEGFKKHLSDMLDKAPIEQPAKGEIPRFGFRNNEPFESPFGKYVLHSDHETALAESRAEVAKYASELQILCDTIMGKVGVPARFSSVRQQLLDDLSELRALREENARLREWRSFDTAPEDPKEYFLVWEEAHDWQKMTGYRGSPIMTNGRPRDEWQYFTRWKGWLPLPTAPVEAGKEGGV